MGSPDGYSPTIQARRADAFTPAECRRRQRALVEARKQRPPFGLAAPRALGRLLSAHRRSLASYDMRRIVRAARDQGRTPVSYRLRRAEALSRPARERAWTARARFEAVLATAAMDESSKSAWCRDFNTFSRKPLIFTEARRRFCHYVALQPPREQPFTEPHIAPAPSRCAAYLPLHTSLYQS